jgi:nucleotide-binding universal stress UspA family protein
MFGRILVPVDFSEYTDEIVTCAVELAKRFGSEIHLFHVVPSMTHLTHYESFLASETVVSIEKGIQEEVEKDLRRTARGIEGIPVTKAVRTGTPFVEIIDYVRQNDIGLIVMGTHGRGGLEHILIGSVAEKVVRKSPCPVLTIRPKDKQFSMP